MTLKKIWQFIWYDNSIWSWLVSAILAFLIVKFLFLPGLGLVLGTTHPIVAVVSGSMEHKTVGSNGAYGACGVFIPEKKKLSFDEFWNMCGAWYQEQVSITKEQFSQYHFKNGFNTGDIMVILGIKPEKLTVGEVIVFDVGRSNPIIHRVVGIYESNGKRVFHTKGDHNSASSNSESEISEEQIIGKAWFKIPWFGYVKLLAVRLIGMF